MQSRLKMLVPIVAVGIVAAAVAAMGQEGANNMDCWVTFSSDPTNNACTNQGGGCDGNCTRLVYITRCFCSGTDPNVNCSSGARNTNVTKWQQSATCYLDNFNHCQCSDWPVDTWTNSGLTYTVTTFCGDTSSSLSSCPGNNPQPPG